jgi:hypothetical protein
MPGNGPSGRVGVTASDLVAGGLYLDDTPICARPDGFFTPAVL